VHLFPDQHQGNDDNMEVPNQHQGSARGFNFLFFGNGEQSHVAHGELNNSQSAPRENLSQEVPTREDLNLHL